MPHLEVTGFGGAHGKRLPSADSGAEAGAANRVRRCAAPHPPIGRVPDLRLLPPRTLEFADDVFVGERGNGVAGPRRRLGQYDQERESEYTLRVYWKISMFERATVFW